MFDHGENHRAELDAILAATAYIMGRNMFGPVRGEWDRDWRGWWGEDPPYHGRVFVLTHHPRDPVPMQGGTTFHFVTDGIESALAQARDAAGVGDISVAGGADTVNQFLAAGLLDILRLHVVPVAVGFSGRTDIVRVFDGVPPRSFRIADVRSTPEVTHITYDLR
jgi:dihydrofolate reductase